MRANTKSPRGSSPAMDRRTTEKRPKAKTVRNLLEAFAVGDAVGMATEFMTRGEILDRFGMVSGLMDPTASKNHSDLKKGRITDDTEQVLALLDEYCAKGRIDPRETAERLLRWVRESQAVERRYIGPSSKAALLAIAEGSDPAEAGKFGTTCGGVMRSPAAILFALSRGLPLKDSILSCLIPTHNTRPALEAAMAYARALEAILEGAGPEQAAEAACFGAAEADELVLGAFCSPSVSARLACFQTLSSRMHSPGEVLDFLYGVFGTGLDSADVATASICLYLWAPFDPWLCIRMGASVGGDTDTIAALAGMLAAASCAALGKGHGIPADILSEVLEVNNLNLSAVAERVASEGS